MTREKYPADWTPEDIASVQPISQRELRRRRRGQTKRQDGGLFTRLLTSLGRQRIAEDESLSTYVAHHRRRIVNLRGKMGSK